MGKVMRFILLVVSLLSLLVFEPVGAMKENKKKIIKSLRKVDNVPSEIVDGLFLGSLGAASDKATLKALEITHVLTVADLHPLYPDDFIYKTIRVNDASDVNLSHFFYESFTFIDEARTSGGRVLVHCLGGVSQSATIVIAYIMKEYHMRLPEAYEHVGISRPVIRPNKGFYRQLKAFKEPFSGYSKNFRTYL